MPQEKENEHQGMYKDYEERMDKIYTLKTEDEQNFEKKFKKIVYITSRKYFFLILWKYFICHLFLFFVILSHYLPEDGCV